MLISCLLEILLCLPAQAPPASVGPDQYLKIIRSSYADVRDLSFVYEGTKKYVLPGGPAEFGDQRNYQFEGNYVWKSDGSAANDVYMRWDNGKDFRHASEVALKDKSIRFERPAERTIPPMQREGPPSPLAIGNGRVGPSPNELIWFWFYQTIKDPAAHKYRDLGWETIDGRRCLKVELDIAPLPPESKLTVSRYRFWLDLEGARSPSASTLCCFLPMSPRRSIQSSSRAFPFSGSKRLWLPVSAVEETYLLTKDSYSKVPVHRNTVRIVQSSLRINQSVPDSRFVVQDPKPDGKTGSVLRRAFDEAYINSKPNLPSDPRSVEERQAKELEEADRQSKMLETTTPAQEFWTGTLLAQIGFFTVGTVLIVATIVLLRRSR